MAKNEHGLFNNQDLFRSLLFLCIILSKSILALLSTSFLKGNSLQVVTHMTHGYVKHRSREDATGSVLHQAQVWAMEDL